MLKKRQPMKRFLTLLLYFGSFSIALAQPLTSLNFREWYNPDSETQLSFQVIREPSQIRVHYNFQTKLLPLEKYSLTWEKRESYSTREGTAIQADSAETRTDKLIKGTMRFPFPAKSWLLIAKITNLETKISWVYFKLIEPNYPVNGWIEKGNELITQKYLPIDTEYRVQSTHADPLFVSFYKTDFPAASPPFADRQIKPDRFMFYDSSYHVNPGSTFVPRKQGLYLFQRDTNSAEGFAFRGVNSIYPKFSKISDLIEPMIFVTTQDEYGELMKADGDKARFDKVVLDITKDKDRAKTFIRNYFRRVELANLYFSSFKPGWKTDRGMIYLIFGLPDEISVNDGSEVWFYKNTKTTFSFVKSGSVYDPENYVLLRDKRFMETWFSQVDLLRKSRF